MNIGERIKELREDNHLTQKQLAEASHISRQATIAEIERSSESKKPPREPTASELVELAKALNTSVHYLATGIDPENITVVEDLGLSNDVLQSLKRWNQMYKDDVVENGDSAFPIIKQIDFILSVLVDSPGIVMTLYEYLTCSYDQVTLCLDESSVVNVPASSLFAKDGFFSTTNGECLDLEATARLRLMDKLKEKRDKLIGGNNHGKS